MSQPSSTISVSQFVPQPLKGMLFSPSGIVLLLALVVLAALNYSGQGKKGKLARAWFGGRREKRAARKLACQQMEAREHNKVALYIGTPRGSSVEEIDGKKIVNLPQDPKTLYIPHAEEGILAVGRPGSGKTYSSIDPLVRSAIDQGFPVFYYDFKGHEDPAPSSKLVGYAQERGYKISIFAPGSKETCVCNPLDFLSSPGDAEMAYQLASVLNQNFKLDDSSSSNSSFFTQTGNQLVQAILMLAKGSRYPDIAMCHKILALPNLIQRLRAAKLDPYLKVAFDNFLSSAGSPETAASIATTASLMFTRFMTPQVLAAFCGQTTLPLDVEGRHFIVFRMDPQKRSVVGPLLAATLHLTIDRNIFRQRKTPLIVSLDELPSIDLPMLADWLNQNRSSGMVCIVGFQALGFLEETYGEKKVNGILSGCTTQMIFQLNDQQTAEYYSKQLGNEEIQYKQKSRSHGKGGASYSSAQQQQTRPLVEIQDVQQFPKGKCILLNPGYGDPKKEIRVPLVQQIKIPKSDINDMKKSAAMWTQIKTQLIKKSTAREPPGEELELREMVARNLLPDPEDAQKAKEYKARY